MIFTYVLVFFVFFAACAAEGEFCSKKGAPGVCVNIRECPDAQQDVANRIRPQICDFTHEDPIVCCVSSTATIERAPKGKCTLPPYPEHGTYTSNVPDGKPGDEYDFLAINVTCAAGFVVEGLQSIYCQNGYGWWPGQMAKCVTACHLTPHPSIEYKCFSSESEKNRSRPCREYEPVSTIVNPRCQMNYYSPTSLQFMRCIGGSWDYVATCTPECGIVTPDDNLIGEKVRRGEVPWQVGVFTKTTEPYRQIGGGSLVSSAIIIGSAHHYWETGKKLSESKFAVAVGKLYRPWNDPVDEPYAQKSDVKEIHLPVRYQGAAANYQEDIAIVVVSKPFELNWHVRPVCLDFDINFDRRQLQPGNKGKVAGWGLTSEDGVPSTLLKVFDVPYQSLETCLTHWSAAFLPYVTSDKICAGTTDGTIAMCKGDSGGGLAFPESDKGKQRYYLRGIMSTAPTSTDDKLCDLKTYVAFTHVLKHEHFIQQFWGPN